MESDSKIYLLLRMPGSPVEYTIETRTTSSFSVYFHIETRTYNKGDNWLHEWKTRFELYPDCKEHDETALQALLVKIGGG